MYKTFDIWLYVLSLQQTKGDPLKSAAWWRLAEEVQSYPPLNGFCYFAITSTALTHENTSSLFTKQKHHCEHIAKREKSL